MYVLREIKIVWIVFSVVIILLFLGLLILDNKTLMSLSPKCISVLSGHGTCFFCGMTRAFLEIKNFNFKSAYLLNWFSVPLFLFFIFNSLVFIFSKLKFTSNENS